MFEVIFQKNWIMRQATTESSFPKINSVGDTVMSSDATCYQKHVKYVTSNVKNVKQYEKHLCVDLFSCIHSSYGVMHKILLMVVSLELCQLPWLEVTKT